MKTVRNLLVFLMILAAIPCAALLGQDQDDNNIIHKVQPGDTLGKLAEKYLGDAKFWHELVLFNDLEPNMGQNDQPVREVLLVPGRVRNKAMASLDRARTVREQALAAKADEYAKDAYRTAEEAFLSADRAFGNTDYVKARGFADVSEKQFIDAIAMADRNAVVPVAVDLATVFGDVKVQAGNARDWVAVTPETRLAPGDRIQTGQKSGAILVFRDRSKLKVREQAAVALKTYSNDRRTNKTIIEVSVNAGTIDGEVNEQRIKDSTFVLESRGNTISVGGVRFYMVNRINGEVGLAVFDGEATASIGGKEPLPVKANKGLVIAADGKLKVSQGLLAAPVLNMPKNNSTSLNQRPELEWLKALGVTQYRVEVSDDISFAHLIDDIITDRLGTAPSILDVGKYFWRVSAVDQNGLVGPPGETWVFLVSRNLDLVIRPSDSLLLKGGMPFATVQHQFNVFPAQQEHSVDWIEVSVDDGGFKRLDGPIQFNREGPHSIRYRAVDVRNERQPLEEYKAIIDDTRPVVQIGADKEVVVRNDNRYAPLERTYMAVATDELAGIRCILVKQDDGEFRDFTPEKARDMGLAKVVSKKMNFAIDGLHTIRVKAQDIAGNWSEENELKINVDKTPPVVKIRPAEAVVPGKDIVFVSGKCTYYFDATDDISGVSKVLTSVDGADYQPVGEFLAPLAAGRHVIQFKGIDLVGNESGVASYALEVDNLPPQTRWRSEPALVKSRGQLYGSLGFFLKFVGEDNLSGIQGVSVDVNDEMLPGVDQSPDGSMKFTKEGLYRIAYFSTDKVRNAEEAKELAFTIDGTPPALDLSIEGPKHEGMARLFVSAKTSIHINAKDEDSGVNRVEVSENGKPFTQYQGPLTGLPQGMSQLTYRGIDNVGNTSDKEDIRITVDNTPPTVWIEKRKDGTWAIQAIDDMAGVHELFAKVDNGELNRFKDQSVLPAGKTVQFWGVDNVGNKSESVQKNLD
ncbi:MAG: FecR domain-containing protein [Planctomycetota bacterium]